MAPVELGSAFRPLELCNSVLCNFVGWGDAVAYRDRHWRVVDSFWGKRDGLVPPSRVSAADSSLPEGAPAEVMHD